MRNTEYFRNKKVTIVGLARSGLACANLLYDLGADVSITDIQDSTITRLNVSKLKSKHIQVELGIHTDEFIRNRDFIIVSPGVHGNSLPLLWAKEFGVPLISEIEAGWILCPAKVIAVTGSNGKTTVTTLIGMAVEATGKKAFVCGNIGTPFCAELPKIGADDIVVLEVSSFQLATIDKFKPKISVILNFSRNHLDRHKNIQEYLDAKKQIFVNHDSSDYLVINQNDYILKDSAAAANSTVVYFSQTPEFNPNQAAVFSVCSILGINKEVVLDVFSKFRGIEHRMEPAGEVNRIKFINDSKATTVESCIWALQNISNPVILIAGGKDKGVDYSRILNSACGKVKEVVLIGEAKELIKKAINGRLNIEEAGTLEEAVNKAFYKAVPGDCVLLSPMCASFDMFSSYEERGRVFKEIVKKIVRK